MVCCLRVICDRCGDGRGFVRDQFDCHLYGLAIASGRGDGEGVLPVRKIAANDGEFFIATNRPESGGKG